MNQSSHKSPYKKAIAISLSIFFLLVAVLSFKYISLFESDIFGKNLDYATIVTIISLSSTAFVSYALPIAITVFSFFYFKEASKLKAIKITGIIPSAFAVLFLTFIWLAFISPYSRLHEYALLYDIRGKSPDKPLTRTDISLFKGLIFTSNLIDLTNLVDSTDSYISNRKSELISFVGSNANQSQIKDLLSLEQASILGLTEDDFRLLPDSNLSSNSDSQLLKLRIILTASETSALITKKERIHTEIYKMILLPFLSFGLYIIGAIIAKSINSKPV